MALRPETQHRFCRLALIAGDGQAFTIAAFSKAVFGREKGRAVSGAGRVLAQMERAGLVRRLGANAFGGVVFALSADPLALADETPEPASPQPPAAAPPPPPGAPWIGPDGYWHTVAPDGRQLVYDGAGWRSAGA